MKGAIDSFRADVLKEQERLGRKLTIAEMEALAPTVAFDPTRQTSVRIRFRSLVMEHLKRIEGHARNGIVKDNADVATLLWQQSTIAISHQDAVSIVEEFTINYAK